jgi:hypothetical protein
LEQTFSNQNSRDIRFWEYSNGHECGHGVETQRNILYQEEPADKGYKMLLPSFPFLLGAKPFHPNPETI